MKTTKYFDEWHITDIHVKAAFHGNNSIDFDFCVDESQNANFGIDKQNIILNKYVFFFVFSDEQGKSWQRRWRGEGESKWNEVSHFRLCLQYAHCKRTTGLFVVIFNAVRWLTMVLHVLSTLPSSIFDVQYSLGLTCTNIIEHFSNMFFAHLFALGHTVFSSKFYQRHEMRLKRVCIEASNFQYVPTTSC